MRKMRESSYADPFFRTRVHARCGLGPAHADGLEVSRLSLRLLTFKDIPALRSLRADVLSGLPHPDLYVREPDEPEFLRTHVDAVKGAGETIGIFDGEHLVAYGMLGLPAPDDPDNLGRFFNSIRPDLKVAHLAGCMVAQGYRGQHLQRILLKARLTLARGRGRNFCVAMASMHNHASRHNLMREGLSIGWVGELDGLKRQLLAIDLAKPLMLEPQRTQVVLYDDWEGQRDLIRRGWWGVDSHSNPNQPSGSISLVFAKAST